MKSYQDFRSAAAEQTKDDLDVLLQRFYEKSDEEKKSGTYSNEALIAGVSTLMFQLMDLRLEAYHNWLVAQLEQSPPA